MPALTDRVRAALTVFVCVALSAAGSWCAQPVEVYRLYLAALALLAFTWGTRVDDVRAAMLGASTAMVAATVAAFAGIALISDDYARRCAERDMYCEDFSGALLVYGAPFVLVAMIVASGAIFGVVRLATRHTSPA